MEAADIFTFRQSDLQSRSFAAFEQMMKKGQFCDLTIKIQDYSITAHRNIVAAGIPYFQSAFDCISSGTEQKEIAVQDNLDPKAFESLILFAYTSKVDITVKNVQALLVAAQFLQLTEIFDSCTEFLSERLNTHNVMQVRKLALGFNSSHLTESCNRYIVKNFEEFSKTPDFLSLPRSFLKEILSEDDLVVSAEETAFEAVMKWVTFSPSERQAALPELLTEIRMIHLPISYLINRVDTEQLITDSKRCRDIVNEVKNRYLTSEVVAQSQNLKTRARNSFMKDLYAVCSCDFPDNNFENGSLVIFTLINSKWLALASREVLGVVRHVVAASGNIYIFLRKTILIFDPGNQEWQHLEAAREDTEGSAVVYHEGKIYCFGSYDSRLGDKMRVFDTQVNEWMETKVMKTNLCDAAAASMGEFIYVTGGFSGHERTNDVEKYCPSEDQWTDAAPMLIKRNQHGCTSMNGKIYVCGGSYSFNTTLTECEVYDPLTDQWEYIFSMNIGKKVCSLVPCCGRIYAFGETELEVYEPDRDRRKTHPSVPFKLKGAVSAVFATRIQNDSSRMPANQRSEPAAL